MNGISPGTALRVAAYPVAWRVETVDDEDHRGFEYVRSGSVFPNDYQSGSLTLHFSFYWATGNIVWDLIIGDKSNGVPVRCWSLIHGL